MPPAAKASAFQATALIVDFLLVLGFVHFMVHDGFSPLVKNLIPSPLMREWLDEFRTPRPEPSFGTSIGGWGATSNALCVYCPCIWCMNKQASYFADGEW
jgi:hypothetical protein